MRTVSFRFFSVCICFLLISACSPDNGDAGGDLPLRVRLPMAALALSSDAQARERIEFQMDFMRAIKRGRIDEAFYLFGLAGVDHGCTNQHPDAAFPACFEGFDFMHAKLLQRSFSPTNPAEISPACAPFLENCQDMRMQVTDGAGHEANLEMTAACRYRGRVWIFGKLACSRRQSDSNR